MHALYTLYKRIHSIIFELNRALCRRFALIANTDSRFVGNPLAPPIYPTNDRRHSHPPHINYTQGPHGHNTYGRIKQMKSDTHTHTFAPYVVCEWGEVYFHVVEPAHASSWTTRCIMNLKHGQYVDEQHSIQESKKRKAGWNALFRWCEFWFLTRHDAQTHFTIQLGALII